MSRQFGVKAEPESVRQRKELEIHTDFLRLFFKLLNGKVESSAFEDDCRMLLGANSFYDESHFRFRAALRRFFDEEVMPDAVSLDARGVHPSKDLWRKLGSRGILASRVQSGPWLQDVRSRTDDLLRARQAL